LNDKKKGTVDWGRHLNKSKEKKTQIGPEIRF